LGKTSSHLVRWLAILVCLWSGCHRAGVGARRAVYYWRTTFALSDGERDMLARQRIERIYLRLFDVKWDRSKGQALPVARCAFTHAPPVAVVPVVYLTNQVFEEAPDPGALAGKIWQEVQGMAQAAVFSFQELQIDCDWTEKTRPAFFDFCRRLRALAGQARVALGATIRLHQIKYPERTGVPPVDRGMLMFYNMGTLAADAPRPSIFNVEDAARYVDHVDRYPLPLDAALAVFSWAIHGREGRVVGLVEKLRAADLDGLPALQRREPGRYLAIQPTFLRGSYLQQGDTLGLETMTAAETLVAARLLARHFHPRHDFSVALFDLDERNLKSYADPDLEAIYAAVR
jgi:hypothetical protein